MIPYVVVSILVAIWFFLLRPRTGGKNAPPTVTWSTVVPVPIFGVIIEFFKSPNTMVKRCLKDIGPVFTVPLFHKRLTFLIGPEAQEIFFKAPDEVLSQNEVYDFMKPVFGPGVVYDATRKKRQVQFSTMASGLRNNRLKAYVAKVEEETRAYLKKEWGEGSGTVDLLKSLSELTILTASRCLHGDDVRQHIFKEIHELYHDLDAGLAPHSVFWPTAPTELHRKRDAARLEMCRLFSKVIKERRENPSRNDGTDILSLFMESKYKDGTPITDGEITGLLIALLFAGQHTSCITSTWTAMFLATNPDILTRMQEEQQQVVGNDQSKALDYDDLNKMEVLHNCMRETLRLCPTFIMILRRAEQDITIKSQGKTYTIPKGDFVVVSPTVSMRMKSTFPDPDTFDPDRYLAPREEHKIPYAYMGFGGGMHSCMGQNFGYMQIKTILSIIFREYDLKREGGMPEINYEAIVVGPVGDCTVQYKKRS